MLAVLVLEVVENAVLLHQARDEIEVGFTVLDAVLALIIGGGQRELVVLEAATLEDLLDNVRDGLVLEDAAIGNAGKEPEPGHDFHLVVGEADVGTALGKSADKAVEVARAVIGQV